MNAFDAFEVLEARTSARCTLWSDASCGLRAILVVDDATLGPAVGGTRVRAYPSMSAAIDDACQLARAMTVKCSLSGLDAGGAKIVVIDHPQLERRSAFARLGRFIEELGGAVRTAGDLGTTGDDLAIMAQHTGYVHTNESDLALSVARGLTACVRACVRFAATRYRASSADHDELAGLRVAVQGCGAIGSAVARTLADLGAHVLVADIDAHLARRVAESLGARVVSPDSILRADVDVICPCATGGVLTEAVANTMRAWAVCGAANNILAGPEIATILDARGVLLVPDVVASAGAVVDGIGERVMGLNDRSALIDGLGDIAYELLKDSKQLHCTTVELAHRRAWERIHTTRSQDA